MVKGKTDYKQYFSFGKSFYLRPVRVFQLFCILNSKDFATDSENRDRHRSVYRITGENKMYVRKSLARTSNKKRKKPDHSRSRG